MKAKLHDVLLPEVQEELKNSEALTLALRIDRALSMCERWQEYLDGSSMKQSMQNTLTDKEALQWALNDLVDALVDNQK